MNEVFFSNENRNKFSIIRGRFEEGYFTGDNKKNIVITEIRFLAMDQETLDEIVSKEDNDKQDIWELPYFLEIKFGSN